jgi:ABC-type multidrug transport system fused ATPase/permease subunit
MFTLIRYACRVAPASALLVFGLAILSAALGVLMTVLVGQVVGAVPDVVSGRSGAMSASTFTLLVAGVCVALVFTSSLPAIQQSARQVLLNHVRRDVTTNLVGPLLRPNGMAHLEDPVVLDRAEQADHESSFGFQLNTGLESVPILVSSRLLLLGSVGLVGHLFSWRVAVGLAVVALFMEWYQGWAVSAELDAMYGQTDDSRKADYVWQLSMRDALKELRVFCLGPWLVNRHGVAFRAVFAPAWRARRKRLWKSLPVAMLHLGAHGLAILLVGRAALAGQLPTGHIATVVLAILAVGAGHSGWAAIHVKRGTTSYRAMRELPDLVARRHPERRPEVRPRRPVDSANAMPQTSIRFEDVSFRYPGSGVDVLRGLNLEIPAGRALALVGNNGAGKSTLVKLIAGMYEPTCGRLTVDGIDLRELELPTWQRQVATIVQDFARFPLSAADNVMLGTTGDARDLQTLRRVAAQSGVDTVIDDFPEAWDTLLDRTFEGGVDLSGGEWQRVALTRALFAVASGASVLVLDEPAAALDVRAEAELVERYLDLTAGVTSLIISHRFSVVRDAHRICVLDGGEIAESGTHDELLAADGRYAQMFTLQAERYAAGVNDG